MSVHLPNMARKNFLQVASRLLLRLGSGCPPPPCEQLNSDDLRRMNLIWTKTKKGRPTFSPGLSLVSATRHHYLHHLTYVAGNLVHWTRGSATHTSWLTDWLTALSGLTGALHAHDQPPWRHGQDALPLAARLMLTHPQSCKQAIRAVMWDNCCPYNLIEAP